MPERPVFVLSLHYKSKEITDFAIFMKQVVDYLQDRFDIKVEKACIGAAGIVYPHRITAQPTNVDIEINSNAIEKLTALKDVFLINDFEAVALGIELLDEKDIIVINKGVQRYHANIAFVGAGTGLGKSLLAWHRDENRYIPVPSEGGHADAASHGGEEFKLFSYIHDNYNVCPISWETILSGTGIQKIYQFLGTQKQYAETEYTKEIARADLHPDRISYYAQRDPRSHDTFKIYTKFYARCAKNFVLDALALNGIYIAGGIAAKNVSLFFDPLFMKEFRKCGKQSEQLAKIPVKLIADYNVSLYGAVVAGQLRDEGLL